jgi:transcriptional regulator with XRE-family HTH domain
MDTETREILARNVKTVRDLRGYNIADLVQRTGLSQRQLNGLERAEKSARLDTIDKLAKALRVPPWVLLMPAVDPETLIDQDLVKVTVAYARLPAAARQQISRVTDAEERYHTLNT